MLLDRLCQFLEECTGRASATRAGDNHWCESAQPHGLQHLLGNDHLLRTLATGLWSQRNTNGIADALLQQYRHRRSRRDDAFRAHAGLGQAEVQGIIATARQLTIDGNQILHAGHLA
jgi:hypothetical protein